MDNALIDLLDRLNASTAAEDVYAVTRDYFQNIGFLYVNIGLISGNEPVGFFSNMREAWLSEYVEAGFFECDVIFDIAMASDAARLCRPETNFALPSRNKKVSDQMLFQIEREGYASALLLPRHSKVSDQIIGSHLISDLPAEALARLNTERYNQIHLGSALTQGALTESLQGAQYGPQWFPFPTGRKVLTPREAEVLRWLAEGFRIDRISDQLSISNATVNFHVTSAKKKLGAKTREQAVAIALTQKLI